MRVILIGAGGHARSCISCVESAHLEIFGLLDIPKLVGEERSGYKVIASDDLIPRLVDEGHSFLIAIGHLSSPPLARQKAGQLLSFCHAQSISVISGDAFVERTATIGLGTIVMHRAFVNAATIVGEHCIVNSGSIIEHDVVVEDFVHISTGTIVNGACHIGSGTFLGSGSVIKQGVSIASNVVVGAGSLVLRNISEPGVYVGAPAKRIR